MSVVGLQVGIFLAGGLLLMLLGVVIFRENPGRRLNRVTGAMLFFGGLGSLMGAAGVSLSEAVPAEALEAAAETVLPLQNVRQLSVLWEFFFPTLILFSLIFPREADVLRRHPRLLWLVYLPYLFHLLLVLLFLVAPDLLDLIRPSGRGGLVGSFLKVIEFAAFLFATLFRLIYQAHVQLWAAVNVLYVILAIYFLRHSGKSLTNRRLQLQVSILQVGIGFSVGIYILVNVVSILLPSLDLPEWVSAILLSLALMIGCGAIAWVIIRHQFLDVQVLAKRGLIYSAATGVVVGVYFLLFTWFIDLYRAQMGPETSTAAVQIIFVAIAVLSFQPLQGRLESIVDRFFIRDETDYRNVLQQSVRNIIGILDMDSLMRAMYQTLERAFLVEEVAVVLLDRKTGAYRFIRRGPPPLKQERWELKAPKELEADDESVDTFTEGGLIEARRRAATGPGRAIFRAGDPVEEVLTRASGPIRFDRLVAEIPEEERSERPPLQGLNPHIVVPIIQRNRLLGIFTLGSKLADTAFNTEELTLLSILASQVAVAVENAWLHEERLEQERLREELAVAREIQQALLPDSFPSGSNFEISAINLPSREIGGDYFDFIVTPPGENESPEKLLMVVGDVSGKGTPAALLMASLQATLRAVYEVQPNLIATMEKVNAVMCRTTAAEKFVTLFVAELDITSRRLTYVNAGHNFPILTRASGEQLLLERGGLLVGVLEHTDYEEGSVQMESGDVLAIYTDGITEIQSAAEEEFGEERLYSALRERSYLAPREIRDEVYREVLSYAGDQAQFDDLTLVVLKCV